MRLRPSTRSATMAPDIGPSSSPLAPWPVATNTFGDARAADRAAASRRRSSGRSPTRTSPQRRAREPGHHAQRLAHDLVHAARGHVGREARVLDRRADRDAVIVPRDHVVAVHLLHDRPAPRCRARRHRRCAICPRSGPTGSCTPNCSPKRRVHAPPAITTASASTTVAVDDDRHRRSPRAHFVDRRRAAPRRRASAPRAAAPRTSAGRRPAPRPDGAAPARPFPSTGTIVARLVGGDLGRARRALGHPLPRRQVGVARRELQDPAARPAVVGIELGQQLRRSAGPPRAPGRPSAGRRAWRSRARGSRRRRRSPARRRRGRRAACARRPGRARTRSPCPTMPPPTTTTSNELTIPSTADTPGMPSFRTRPRRHASTPRHPFQVRFRTDPEP